MPKKNWTPEERQAFAERMKAARAKKQKPKKEPTPTPVMSQDTGGDEDVDELKNRIALLEKMILAGNVPDLQSPTIDRGKMTGVYEKYRLGAENYPNPIERLSDDPKLKPFAFKENYELKFTVGKSSYQTIDGINTTEPKFTIQLIRKMLDENTGEDTGKRYGVNQLIFHEDPDTALSIADEVGFPKDSMDEETFLNEMRYLRMRDWLLGCFFPEPPTPSSAKKEVVIGNRLVEVWEVNSEDPQRIDFGALKHKL